ncbi:MAG: ABC transporter ATP-binding protein [Lachnospiraceae bacterium]|nr:ABC transporter ATP-binding protein [Lachnospiraceae bacterium]
MLKIEHLRKSYADFTLDCSLSVPPGCVTGLVGKNGAGKSTTFKAILGLISRDQGSIEIMGKKLEQFTEKDKQKLGVSLADSGFSIMLNIQDIAAILKAMYGEFDNDKFLAKCQQFQLPLHKKVREFSTGMKAKLRLLAAVNHKAQLLILDEPALGLDVMARDEILDILRTYMEEDEKRSILISSHISSDLESICDDIYMIDEGSIVLHEETHVLLSDYALLKLNDQQWRELDKKYVVKYKKESFGVSCLTRKKQYYIDNFPEIVVEKGNIDNVITMMVKGENV